MGAALIVYLNLNSAILVTCEAAQNHKMQGFLNHNFERLRY